MSGAYNPSDPATLGLEWLVADEPSTFVLGSAAASYGMYLPGVAGKLSEELAAYAQAVSGFGHYGSEVLSAPYVEAIPQSYETRYAGTDTGADFTSPTNSNAAWLDAGGGVASYADVSPGVDDSTYLKNVNQIEGAGAAAARLWMRGASTTQWTARRVCDVEVHVRIRCTLSSSPTIEGVLNLGGNVYAAQAKAVPLGQGYVDMTLGTWLLNPSTGKPWTLPEINNLITTGATDEFGLRIAWDARQTTDYADTIRISSVYLRIRWQPEDRCGYASGDVSATGWHAWDAKSVPNLLTQQDGNLDVLTGGSDIGSWVADANTTLTNDTDDPGGGWTRSLKIDPTAAGAAGALGGYYPVIPGKTYAFRGYAKWTTGTNLVLSIQFYDANGNLLQTAAGAADVGNGSYQATGMTAPATAPAGATQAKLHVVLTAAAGTDSCFITGMFFGLDQAAITFVQDSYPGALAKIKVNGGAEVNEIAHPVDELRIFRRISGTGSMSLRTFGPGTLPLGMPLSMTSYRPVLQDVAGALLDVGDEQTDVAAFFTTSLHDYDTADGPIAEYSQPYAERVARTVDTSHSAYQEVTLDVATYRVVRFVVAGLIEEPDGTVTIKLKKVSDNSQVGGDVTFDATDLEAIIPPGGTVASKMTPQVLALAIPTPAANAAAQYYIEITADSAVGEGFVFYVLDTMGATGDSIPASNITFAAGVDAWSDTETGELLRRTGMIVLQTQPAAPTGVTATVVGNRILIEWDATAVGAEHDATEIARYDDRALIDSFGYQQIADLADEAEVAYYDGESRRGVDTTYKVRSRRTDGSVSDWSAETTPVSTPATDCGEPTWWFVSNEITDDAWVGGQQYTDDEWGTPPQAVVLEFEGRDGAVAFLPIEDPLDEFDMAVALYWTDNQLPDAFLTDPPTTGRAAFNKLVALARSSLSYVCILDNEGNRWFANIQVGPLVRSRPNGDMAGGYVTTLHVRELQRVPSTPIASVI